MKFPRYIVTNRDFDNMIYYYYEYMYVNLDKIHICVQGELFVVCCEKYA